MRNWTKEQEAAIDARGSNLLVAAAAGSGKTAVLVERIIQIILKDKIDIDKLLIVTFTNAAAGEMRERIAGVIMEEMDKKTDNEEHLRKQINLLNRASITTIHSFCIDVVRRHFHIIDVDPGFRIGDVTETSIMRLEALEELFEEEYENADELFFQLVETFGGTKEDRPLQNKNKFNLPNSVNSIKNITNLYSSFQITIIAYFILRISPLDKSFFL